MPSDVLLLHVRAGHVTLDQSYIYCWLHPQDARVLYVGATWMHPAARIELHLHGRDAQARIVGAQFAQRGIALDQPMQIVAFPTPPPWDRTDLKRRLLTALAQEQLLSGDYCGPPPEPHPQAASETIAGWIAHVVGTLRDQQP